MGALSAAGTVEFAAPDTSLGEAPRHGAILVQDDEAVPGVRQTSRSLLPETRGAETGLRLSPSAPGRGRGVPPRRRWLEGQQGGSRACLRDRYCAAGRTAAQILAPVDDVLEELFHRCVVVGEDQTS